MKRMLWLGIAGTGFLACLLHLVPTPAQVRAEDQEPDVQKSVQKGLKWLASQQRANTGHWEANGGQYPTSMTALAGMSLLMEGSTLREGKYSEQLQKAVTWFMDRSQPNGLLGNPNNPTESARYMYGHGFGLLFLASIYGEEEDGERRRKLEKMLTKAVEFAGKAQTTRGGWGYVSAADGGGFDEGSVTITQLQALRAARNAGIVVPKSIIDKSIKYLKDCTTTRGGIIYSLAHGAPVAGTERPPLTAAAVACSFSAGEYDSEYAKKWLLYCKEAIPFARGRVAHDEYQSYYFAQAMYVLGDDRYGKLFPTSKPDDRLLWSKYKSAIFDHLIKTQSNDGSWTAGYIGPVYTTSVNLTILQLEKATLPIYDR
ncbi:prenyltransferase/squalene oxidase repeat-containing protein [Tuwongella immobilis]|uniref:Squalene cyclase C-terminal domain-containing protein n=1 Tax=Tuwongella immobilis TaxID=692036 RepID=A0A6C2YR96_9BACT|nr:prenyltransferase/squalene oxidase repeat-containing protein [Tuwongella immobilis]VIP03877.1 Uncharacterized protein OS=Planctomyces limnophilus (strain ATCC 43296 / DSM 3776 / IFAM 1008 / 290) GN=Plim_2834 PE=4 SV=1: Prenyltrans_2 [Tuwongella immobilis]VTS05121.1 Uncharacterized protein OS=Planctomyces limnophilus (strain ATCC 43296 / DSM 3776 / IFAM 1008 / 290) GN=Plim_2834 PE=4 SV=1: Prenyltrans_2 [Tuwongella immobilis]